MNTSKKPQILFYVVMAIVTIVFLYLLKSLFSPSSGPLLLLLFLTPYMNRLTINGRAPISTPLLFCW